MKHKSIGFSPEKLWRKNHILVNMANCFDMFFCIIMFEVLKHSTVARLLYKGFVFISNQTHSYNFFLSTPIAIIS